MLLEVAFKGFCGSFEVHGRQKVTNQDNPEEALQRLQKDSGLLGCTLENHSFSSYNPIPGA